MRPTLALALLLSGCVAAETTYEPEPYDGDAYPNRRAPIAWPDGPAGIVTDSLSDTISFVDVATGQRFDHRPVGRDPVDLDGPHHVAASIDRGEFFIALSYPAVAALGPHAGHGESSRFGWVQRLSLEDGRILGEVRVDANPGDIALSADGSRVVVSHFDLAKAVEAGTDVKIARASLAVLDADEVLATGSPSPRRISTCAAPHALALLGPSGDRAIVACYAEDRLAIVDLEHEGSDAGAVELVDVGPGVVFGAPSYGPYALALSPDEALVVVSNTVSKDLRLFDVEARAFDLERTFTIPGGGAPMFAAFDAGGRELVVAVQAPDAVVRFDLETLEQLSARPFQGEECPFPHDVEIVDGDVLVVCEGDKTAPGKVVKLSAELTLLSSTPVGIFPDAVAVVR